MALTSSDVYFDMYDRELYASPYATYGRLREEAPLYRNEEHDFWLVSRNADAARVLQDRDTFSSSKGSVLNIMTSGVDLPAGLFIAEDPPLHTIHRSLVSRLFTPRAISRIEPEIQTLFHGAAESLRGESRFDFVQDFATMLPIQVIGMLLGLPAKDHAALREVFHKAQNEDTANPEASTLEGIAAAAVWFTEYLDFRAENPTDDLMTQLLNTEFEDETGTRRLLQREELLTFLILITAAGSDTTVNALAWAGSLLADHPEQRQKLIDDPGLVPVAVEEVLRYEPPAYHISRLVMADVELHGEIIPEGSAIVALPGAANRDPRVFPDGDTFDVTRSPGQVFTFSFGPHFCLGASLARLETRIALEAALANFGEWSVDRSGAVLTKGIDTRGWDALPVEL